MEFKHLFTPIKIRGLELRNRVVFPAMATKMISDGGYMTQRLIDYHVARALGGNGLNIVEATSVHAPSAPRCFLNISEDKFIPGLKQFNDAVHQAGGKTCVQLWQGGMVATMTDPAAQMIVPSDFPISATAVVPGATVETIKEVVKAWGQAARRAAEAGFDAVEFHAAHNYSPHMFLSPYFNRRTDEYGGSLENRARYLLEAIQAIRSNIPADMPIIMRVDAQDDNLEPGLTIEDIIAFCKMAGAAGVDALDVSRGNVVSAAAKYEVPSIDLPRGFNVDNAARIRQETGIITIAVGRINDPKQADDILAEGKADMVVMGRAQIADPDFLKKSYSGDVEDIIRCVACNQGCFDRYVDPAYPHISCMRNPAVGREAEYGIIKTNTPKKVLVVGGGMAGLEAAIVLKQRGHNPILAEASGELGGQFLLAGAAPRKEEMREAAISRGKQALKAGVDVRLSTRVTPELVKDLKPEAVIIATGASPMIPDIPGKDLPHVSNSYEVLNGEVEPKGHVVVVGGGLVGLEVAELLTANGCSVTVVEMLDEVGKDIGQGRQISVKEHLYMAGIKALVNKKAIEIKDNAIVVEQDGQREEIPADAVVIAIGSKSNRFEEIKAACDEQSIALYVVGDAVRPRRVIDAIAEASEVARAI